MPDTENEELRARVTQLENIVNVLIGFIAKNIDDNEKVSFGWSLENNIDLNSEFGKDWPKTKKALRMLSRSEIEDEKSKPIA